MEAAKVKEALDYLIKNHNQTGDQVWQRTLKTSSRGNVTEIIGVCNYGNLYFAQLSDDGKARMDWIKKTYLGKKYRDVPMDSQIVRDNVLDMFRNKI